MSSRARHPGSLLAAAGAGLGLLALWMPWYRVTIPDSLKSSVDALTGNGNNPFGALVHGLLRALPHSQSDTRVILYTGYGDDALLSDALDAGVGGVIDKEAPLDDLVRAIRTVADGGTYLDPTAAAALIAQRRRNRTRELTQRERDVLRLLSDGNSNEQIGAVLSISPQTVRTHVQKAMEKLGATTRVQAVAIALRESLIA